MRCLLAAGRKSAHRHASECHVWWDWFLSWLPPASVAAQRPRFAAPHAQRSELKASVNNALLGDDLLHDRMRANSEHAAKRVHRSTKARCLPEAVVVGKGEYFVDCGDTLIG
jgi:hypothetical protein